MLLCRIASFAGLGKKKKKKKKKRCMGGGLPWNTPISVKKGKKVDSIMVEGWGE